MAKQLLVRDSAMGKWFQALSPEAAVAYIYDCLRTNNSSDNVFWHIVERYDLRAPSPLELSQKVYEHLYDFDLNSMDGEE